MKIQLLGTGVAVLLLNVTLLSMLATGAVEGAVDENFATFPLDEACEDTDCTTMKADWTTSTSEQDYYVWSMTNSAAVAADGSVEPTYEKVGPFTYSITSTKTFISHDPTAGELKYSESKSYECAADSEVACDTEVTAINIPFRAQVIGATNMYIGTGVMGVAQLGFAAGVMANDLDAMQAGVKTGSDLALQYAGATAAAGGDAGLGSAGIGNAMFDGFDAYFSATYGAPYSTLNDGQKANFTNLSYAMDSAVGPGGEDISLTGSLGPTLLAGHCDSYATANYTTVMADAANGFANVGTMQRANLWGFMAMASETMPDVNTTIARDHAMCAGVGMAFLANGGGDSDWMTDTTNSTANASVRLNNLLGINLTDATVMNLLFAGMGTETPTGLLASTGTDFGLGTFIQTPPADAMANFGLNLTEYSTIAGWAVGWLSDTKSLPMILKGGSGELTASRFINISFGDVDPINSEYLASGVNLGENYLALMGLSAATINESASGNILYGPLGITTQSGAVLFQYGELSGYTPPMSGPGTAMPWTDATVAGLYGIDVDAAKALRNYMHVMANQMTPNFLKDSFGTSEYLTQSANAWLLGWADPVLAATDTTGEPDAAWTSLETNATYFGSGGISTGPATTYTICTGEVSTCDKGETLLEDGSAELSWHNTAMATATFGLVGVESIAGTTGGFITGTGDKVDLAGYAIADVTCSGTSTVKGIPTNTCSASLDETTRLIQAKLLNTVTLLDATPSALPVYFGSEVSLETEQLSGLIISGSSTSTFYLDTRNSNNMTTAPLATDLVPVFQISRNSMIADSDAEDMESAIVQNQDMISYWMNFDSPIDFVAILLYIGGVALIIMHFVANKDDEEGFEAQPAESESEDSEPEDPEPAE
jgi:hypothetical protein